MTERPDRRQTHAAENRDPGDVENIPGLPEDWRDHFDPAELRGFVKAASVVPAAGVDRVQRLILHSIRIRREMHHRYGPLWWKPREGGWG